MLFVGTLFFAVSLVAAFAERADAPPVRQLDLAPRHPGCVCFLVSGHLAMLDVGDGRVRILPRDQDWWIVVINQVGSVLFFLAGLAAFIRPATSEAINVELVNWGTFSGAVCFAIAGLVQARFVVADMGTTTA